MNRKFSYCLLFLALGAEHLAAQAPSCERNMLSTPNASSYAVIPSPKFSLPGAFTIEFWAQSNSFVPHSGLVEQTNTGDTGAFSIGFGGGDSLVVTLKLNTGIANFTTSAIANIQNWQHYAVTFSPKDSVRIYINGILKSSQKTSASNIIASTDSIFISHSKISGATFTGNMDELRIWNIVRSASNILGAMNAPLAGNESGLKAYYSFDDDPSQNTIHDFSGGKSTASIISNAILAPSTSPVSGSPSGGYMLASKEQSIFFSPLSCTDKTDTIVHIFNRGTEQVNIDPVAFRIGTIFSASVTGFPLPPDSTKLGSIRIQANPKVPGKYFDTLIVSSTTICGGILRIPVELKYDVVSIAFEDTLFKLHDPNNVNRDLLPCELPLSSQTFLDNTGTKDVTVTSLGFSPQAGIDITSPQLPFTIRSKSSQAIHFTVQPGNPGPINTTLTATTAECSRVASMKFSGNRIVAQFQIPNRVNFPQIHLPVGPILFDTTIVLHNTGTSALSFTNPPLALIGVPGYQLLAPKSGLAVVKPDSSLAITIRYTASGSECALFETALHLQDQSNCGLDTLIPISINILGPDVSPAQATYDFGANCFAHDTTITFINKSGRMVTLGKPSFAKDSIFSLIGGTLPKQLASGDSIALTFRFAPKEPGAYSIDARFQLSPCGETDLHFAGLLGIGNISLSDSILDFGNGCDSFPTTRIISITNKTGKPITVNKSAFDGSQQFSVISPIPFQMAIGETKIIIVQFTPKQLGILEEGRINLYDDGCFVTKFGVRGVWEKANIMWSRSYAEFDTVCPGKNNSIVMSVQNLGYGDDTILSYRFIGDSGFAVNDIKNIRLAHGSSKQIQLTFSPKEVKDYYGQLEMILAPCGALELLSLHGVGGPAAVLTLNTLIDFGTVRAGTMNEQCAVLQNPSCNWLYVGKDSMRGINTPFTLSQNSLAILPDSVNADNPLTLCFDFNPPDIGSFGMRDTLHIGNQIKIISLRGNSGEAKISYNPPRTIDFGDVQKDSSLTRQLKIFNKGSYDAQLTASLPQKDFYLQNPSPQVGIGSSLPDFVTFAPTHFGLQTSFIVFQWENHFDTIFLIGRGIQPGLKFPITTLDFGNVRVGHDSVLSVLDSNTLDTEIVFNSVRTTGRFSSPQLGSSGFIEPGIPRKFFVTYSPNQQGIDGGLLIVGTTFNDADTLILVGRGVEAHLKVDSTNLNFGDVNLGKSLTKNLLVSNTGGYPLAISSVHHNVPVFDTATGGVFIIPPDSSVQYSVRFTPQRAIAYFDTLDIEADAPEKNANISLSGKGVFGPQSIPEVTYNIPPVSAKVGDIVELSIFIGGKDLRLFDLDSFDIVLSYDPTVVYFHDTVITNGTLSSGFTITFTRIAGVHDSEIEISGRNQNIIADSGRLFILQAEALLGPNDSTRIFIESSEPKNTASPLTSSGEFVVSDCGNYRGGIIQKGNYSVSEIKPNPVSSSAHIEYEIGLTGNVNLDLYDVLGRHALQIMDGTQTRGKHSAQFSIDVIPSGEYIVVLKSLEYEYHGKLMISK